MRQTMVLEIRGRYPHLLMASAQSCPMALVWKAIKIASVDLEIGPDLGVATLSLCIGESRRARRLTLNDWSRT
jgi:hypothetical protein